MTRLLGMVAGMLTAISLLAGGASATGIVYVADKGINGKNSILVYRKLGNVAPHHVIKGSNTQLDDFLGPERLAFDAKGYLYVLIIDFGPGKILVFAPGAEGNVAPVRVIAGHATHLDIQYIMDLDLDKTGKLYAAVDRPQFPAPPGGSKSRIQEYAPGAGLNAPVINSIDAGPQNGNMLTLGMALSKASPTMWVSAIDSVGGNAPVKQRLMNFPIGASGAAAPTCQIAGAATGMKGNLVPGHVATFGNRVSVFVGESSLFHAVYTYGGCGNVAPVYKLTGVNAGWLIRTGLVYDPQGWLYVLSSDGFAGTNSAVTIFKPGNQTGNAFPDAVISGPNTLMQVPTAVAIGP